MTLSEITTQNPKRVSLVKCLTNTQGNIVSHLVGTTDHLIIATGGVVSYANFAVCCFKTKPNQHLLHWRTYGFRLQLFGICYCFPMLRFPEDDFFYVPLCNYVPIGNVRKERKDLFFKKVIVHDLENETEAGQVPQKSERQNGWTKGCAWLWGVFCPSWDKVWDNGGSESEVDISEVWHSDFVYFCSFCRFRHDNHIRQCLPIAIVLDFLNYTVYLGFMVHFIEEQETTHLLISYVVQKKSCHIFHFCSLRKKHRIIPFPIVCPRKHRPVLSVFPTQFVNFATFCGLLLPGHSSRAKMWSLLGPKKLLIIRSCE